MSKIKVLIIDDDLSMRRLINDVLGKDPSIEVMGTAPNDAASVNTAIRLAPDIITLGVDMPEMNNIGSIRTLRQRGCKTPIIVISNHQSQNSQSHKHIGSSNQDSDYSKTPSGQKHIKTLERELIPKIKELFHRRNPQSQQPPPAPKQPLRPRFTRSFAHRPNLLCIGSSTGGPNALEQVFSRLPANFPVPIMLVQHMPDIFIGPFAERLDARHPLHFTVAKAGMTLQPGTVYIAPGDKHMEISPQGPGKLNIRLTNDPPLCFCRPAADAMLNSVHRVNGVHPLTVILTGMGNDGLEGCRKLHAAGYPVIAQDEDTSVVWGMPGYVVKNRLADLVLPIDRIAEGILQFIPAQHIPA